MRGTIAIATAALLVTAGTLRAQPPQPVEQTLGDRVAASERTRTIKRLSDRAKSGVGSALGAAGNAVDRTGRSLGRLFGRLDATVTETLGGIGLQPNGRGAGSSSRPGWGNRDRWPI